jgi:long-chain acyl-CoA synthetase
MATGLEYVEAQEFGRSPSPELAARFAAADEQVLTPIRALLGLDRVEWATSAAAPMPLEVARFFAGLGMRIYDVYGMTETTAAVTACGPGQFRLGTVGRPLAGIEVTLAEDGEILARGPVATPGYFRQEDATAALVDAEGWVHTGDIGVLDDDGFLRVVDRKKEMIITSSGKNVAPSNIENLLKESSVVGHALVFGEGRPYCVAVLTLDGEVAPLVAHQLGIDAGSLAELAQHPAIVAMAQDAVDKANARLSRPEQVKAFELLPVEWTAESEELTPTLKLKRRVVHQKYADVLDRLYAPAGAR